MIKDFDGECLGCGAVLPANSNKCRLCGAKVYGSDKSTSEVGEVKRSPLKGIAFLFCLSSIFTVPPAIRFIKELDRYWDSSTWVPSECRIVESQVKKPNIRTPHYRTVRYSYLLNGNLYEGRRITFFPTAQLGGLELTNHLTVNAVVPCWVNPKLPSDSVVNRDNTDGITLRVVALLHALAAISLLIFFLIRRGLKRSIS